MLSLTGTFKRNCVENLHDDMLYLLENVEDCGGKPEQADAG